MKRTQARRNFIAAGMAGLLSACAGLPKSSSAPVDAPAVIGPAFENIIASGRLSLRQSTRSDHLKFDWQHSTESDRLLLLSPLGQGLAELIRDAEGVRLIRPGTPPLKASDFATLSQQLIGQPLPLDELGAWLVGARGDAGRIGAWQIRVSETTPYRQRRLPRRLEASRDELALTLIVDEWSGGE